MNPHTRRVSRVFCSALAGVALLVLTACQPVTKPPTISSGALPPPDTLPAPTHLSSRITDYMQLGGDRVVVVPDGVYRAGVVTAPHGATNGPYGGWLILVAQHPGQVVVDMLNDPDPYYNNEHSLRMQAGTSRVMFVGISFRNGVIRNYGNPIRFWYCDHQDADYQYLTEGRTAPRMFQSYWGADNLEIYGDDFHNGVASPLVFGSGRSNVTIRHPHLRHRTTVPGPGRPDAARRVDGSPPGSHQNLRVLDSYLEGYYSLWGTDSGNVSDVTWQNIWYGYGNASPFILQAVPGRRIVRATRMNGRSLARKRGSHSEARIRTSMSTAFTTTARTRINIATGSIWWTQTFATATRRGDRRSWYRETSPANPALVWRAAHSYDSWSAYFGWS